MWLNAFAESLRGVETQRHPRLQRARTHSGQAGWRRAHGLLAHLKAAYGRMSSMSLPSLGYLRCKACTIFTYLQQAAEKNEWGGGTRMSGAEG